MLRRWDAGGIALTVVPDVGVLVHLCTCDDWRTAQQAGVHRPESLDTVGFVHLSTPEQVHLPANRLYSGRTDLMLLRIDAARLSSPVRWEPGVPGDPGEMVFPHLYGALPVSAVISVTPYLPDADGSFPATRATHG
ncbi:MAG: DUF952 domain-containing protein [Mycobacterium sp.]|nr:DUF952 domain-containing protein [Mycobacterium sp.]